MAVQSVGGSSASEVSGLFLSRFRDANGADHRASARRIKERKRVKYPWPYPNGSKGEEMIDPALPIGDSKNEYDDDTGGDGSPFVIFDLSRSAGKRLCGHIKPGKSTDSATHEID